MANGGAHSRRLHRGLPKTGHAASAAVYDPRGST